MTTARPSRRHDGRGTTLPVVATALVGVVVGVLAAVLADGSAVAGVVVGVVLTFASLGLGSLVLAWVTEVSPGMSLVVALMTYTLQVVLLLAAYVVLSGSAAAQEAVSGRWLGLTVIATTVVWLALQVQALRTSRQPYLEPASSTPARGGTADEEGAAWASPAAIVTTAMSPPAAPTPGSEGPPSRESYGDPWQAFGYVVAGVGFYGVVGWLLDRWLGTSFLVAIGIFIGASLGIYMTLKRFGAVPGPPDAQAARHGSTRTEE